MSEIPNWFYRTSIKALILDENKKFLLTREEKWWELPWWCKSIYKTIQTIKIVPLYWKGLPEGVGIFAKAL